MDLGRPPPASSRSRGGQPACKPQLPNTLRLGSEPGQPSDGRVDHHADALADPETINSLVRNHSCCSSPLPTSADDDTVPVPSAFAPVAQLVPSAHRSGTTDSRQTPARRASSLVQAPAVFLLTDTHAVLENFSRRAKFNSNKRGVNCHGR